MTSFSESLQTLATIPKAYIALRRWSFASDWEASIEIDNNDIKMNIMRKGATPEEATNRLSQAVHDANQIGVKELSPLMLMIEIPVDEFNDEF